MGGDPHQIYSTVMKTCVPQILDAQDPPILVFSQRRAGEGLGRAAAKLQRASRVGPSPGGKKMGTLN